jgi:hypothetical protein
MLLTYNLLCFAPKADRTSLRDATRVADQTLRRYTALRESGQNHQAAREQTSREMAQRFDNQGRDMQQQQRQRSYEMSR